MDIISHGLWGGAAFGRRSKKYFKIAFLFGMLPDLFAFTYVFFQQLFSGAITSGPFHHVPLSVAALYSISHSFVVAGIVIALAFVIWRRRMLPVLAWPLHIFLDVFTHDIKFFATPYLWPFHTFLFDGISWNTPWIFIANWGALILVYIYLLKFKKVWKKKS